MAAQAYLTYAEFVSQVGSADAVAILDQPTIETDILWASSIADSYLGKRYMLPLISWGEMLKAQVGDLARWRLMPRIGVRPGSGNNEVARVSFEDAIRWFKDASTGAVIVDCVDSTPDLDEEGALSASGAVISFRTFTGPRECE